MSGVGVTVTTTDEFPVRDEVRALWARIVLREVGMRARGAQLIESMKADAALIRRLLDETGYPEVTAAFDRIENGVIAYVRPAPPREEETG